MSAIRTLVSSVEEHVILQSCGSSSDMRRGVEALMGGKSKESREKAIREEAAKSKTGIWGPTHSCDSDEETPGGNHVDVKKEGNSDTTKEETTSEDSPSPQRPNQQGNPLNRLYESALSAMTPTSRSLKNAATSSCLVHDGQVHEEDDDLKTDASKVAITSRPAGMLAALDPCRPCSNPRVDSPTRISPSPAAGCSPKDHHHHDDKILKKNTSEATQIIQDLCRSESVATPASRRRMRHMERLKTQARLELANNAGVAPLKTLEVRPKEVERSISELTMRSSYGEATAKLAEQRRMAYYAVGKHHGRGGGNRRCYFSGKLILGGAPFYAGSVQQGLRTLVVFCLPSALGLPLPEGGQSVDLRRQNSYQSIASVRSKESSVGFSAQPRTSLRRLRTASVSRLSSLDDMSLSYEEEDDVNAHLDREYLLRVLPPPSQDLLDTMADRYPEQFETLPVQVRSPHCWRLFVKFCFFSGLPIAEGEMHYKVQDHVAEVYGEEIILSHEVMEAVNGESAEILRLPNQKTFRYLQKHYTQQCGKLGEEVFQRQSWEVVLPEV